MASPPGVALPLVRAADERSPLDAAAATRTPGCTEVIGWGRASVKSLPLADPWVRRSISLTWETAAKMGLGAQGAPGSPHAIKRSRRRVKWSWETPASQVRSY